MTSRSELIKFLMEARMRTYAGNSGKVESLIPGSVQLEYSKNDWLYRDVYNIGNGKFVGMETVYCKEKPVWSMSYFGNFEKMNEKEVDSVLRKALVDKWNKTRLWESVEHRIGDFMYYCDGSGDEEEFDGSERIEKDGDTVYFFYYASAVLIK